MSKKSLLTLALLAAGTLMSAQVFAQAYVGGSVGRAKWDIDCTGATGCHTGAGGFKLYGGSDFTPNFGWEGSYVYLNEVSANAGPLQATFNGRGADLAVMAKTPVVKNFVGFAKLGVAFMKGELIASIGPVFASDTNYSSQPLGALGVMYQVDKKLSIRAEFDTRKVKVSGFPQTTSNVNMFSLGIQSEF
jgi:OOP family OmpA-OmpF porin